MTTSAETNAGKESTPLILIHGVGHHKSKSIENDVIRQLKNESVLNITAHEFNWDQLLKKKEKDVFFDPYRLKRLGLNLMKMAWLETERYIKSPKTKGLLEISWGILAALFAILLINILWYFFALTATKVQPDVLPLKYGITWLNCFFPPLPDPLLASSTPLASSALKLLLVMITGYLSLLSLITLVFTKLSFRHVIRIGIAYVLWPFIFSLGILPIVLIYLLFITLVTSLFNGIFSLKFIVEFADHSTLQVGPGYQDVFIIIGIVILLFLLAIGVSFLLWIFLKPVFDLANYLGDSDIRTFIHKNLRGVIKKYQNKNRIILGGHSLGSIIAIDSLLSQKDIWKGFHRIDLITAGSPLSRLLTNFFPLTYPKTEYIVDEFQSNYREIRWLNIYRILDYIGGKLPDSRISNHGLFRLSKFWKTHPSYWGDKDVMGKIMKNINNINPLSGSVTPSPTHTIDFENLHKTPLVWQFAKSIIKPLTIIIIISGFIGIFWSQFIWLPYFESSNLTYWKHQSENTLSATVEHAKIIDNASERSRSEFGIIVIHYNYEDTNYYAQSRPRLFYVSNWFPQVNWKELEKDLNNSSEKLQVKIKISKNQPEIFYLPDYETTPNYYTFGKIVLYAFRSLSLCFFWILLCMALYKVLTLLVL